MQQLDACSSMTDGKWDLQKLHNKHFDDETSTLLM